VVHAPAAGATTTPDLAELASRIFHRTGADSRVWVADGFGVKVTVQSGHLVVSDGIGTCRRVRRMPKVDRTLRRIVVASGDGYISLAALRWCKDHQIAVITVNPFGELVAASAHSEPPDAPTIRAQARCGPGGGSESTGVKIARLIVEEKLARQAETASNVLGRPREANEIKRLAGFLANADSPRELNLIEAEAARRYYDSWSDVTISWQSSAIGKIPEHWLTYRGRKNPLSNRNNNAVHPVNAMLNYAYRMLEVEARLACVAAGLDPSLGMLHADRYDRDSLAMDLMESVRPEADQAILRMLAHPGNDLPRRFTRRDFTETLRASDYPAGTVRLLPPLTHEIAEQAITWSASLYRVAEEVARMVAGTPPGRAIARTPTADTTIMRPARQRSVPMPASVPTTADILPDSVWTTVESLALDLPHPPPAMTNVDHRDVIAALVFSRASRVSREKAAPIFGVSANTLERRFRAWRDLEGWHKLEAFVMDHLRTTASPSRPPRPTKGS
jgi:CRISP-associated protein Cas1